MHDGTVTTVCANIALRAHGALLSVSSRCWYHGRCATPHACTCMILTSCEREAPTVARPDLTERHLVEAQSAWAYSS